MNTLNTFGLAAALSVLTAGGAWAQAQTNTFTSAPAGFQGDSEGASAQVGTSGANTGGSYLDIADAGNSYSGGTFGVVDFTGNSVYSDPPAGTMKETLGGINPNVTLTLGDTAFGPTSPTSVNFYLSDSSASLSSLTYQTSDISQTAGVGNQLGDLYYLGSGMNTDSGGANSGSTFSYHLTLPAAAQSYVLQQLNADNNPLPGDLSTPNLTTLRLVITAADSNNPTGLASFAGSNNVGPTLTVTTSAAVPEASTTISLGLLLALGLGGLAVARRRRAA